MNTFTHTTTLPPAEFITENTTNTLYRNYLMFGKEHGDISDVPPVPAATHIMSTLPSHWSLKGSDVANRCHDTVELMMRKIFP